MTMSAIAESLNARVSKDQRAIRPLLKTIFIEPGKIIFNACCTRVYYQMMMKEKKTMMPGVVHTFNTCTWEVEAGISL